jgi:hypothetical protein
MQSPELAFLAEDAGTWSAEMVVNGPSGPQRSVGRSVSRMLGGRWLVTDFKNETGFEGHGVYGFDPARGAYVGTWVDDMRPFLPVMEGRWDEATRTMTYVGEATMNGRPFRWRETTERVDADTRVFRTFMPTPDGGEFEVVTATYRRIG